MRTTAWRTHALPAPPRATGGPSRKSAARQKRLLPGINANRPSHPAAGVTKADTALFLDGARTSPWPFGVICAGHHPISSRAEATPSLYFPGSPQGQRLFYTTTGPPHAGFSLEQTMHLPSFDIEVDSISLRVHLDDDSPEWCAGEVFVGDSEISSLLSKEAVAKIEKAVEAKMQELRDEARIAAYEDRY